MKLKGKYLPTFARDLVEGKRVHYVVQYGAKRRTSYISYKNEIEKVFNKKSLKYGNDAPRGGALGNWVELDVKK